MTSRSVIVEFLGLPGVGKTTLATEILERLHRAHIPVRLAFRHTRTSAPPVRRMHDTLAVASCLRWPRYLLSSTREIAATRQRSSYDYMKVLYNWLNTTAEADLARRQTAVVMFDQGPYQALWTIGYSAREPNVSRLAELLRRRVPPPDLLVLLEADAATVLERLIARAGSDSRLDPARSGLASHDELARPQVLLDHIAEHAAEVAPLLKLDTTCAESLEANASHLVETISATWAQA